MITCHQPLPSRALISFNAVATSSTANRMSSALTTSPGASLSVSIVASRPRMTFASASCRSCKRCSKRSTSLFE
nr:MAG TPA: hypothetical protein [Caudoviricetes sp.]